MAWNPDVYNQFKKERFLPFEDSVKLINQKPGMDVIDLGCGTGELTAKLSASLAHPRLVFGIDSSVEMLEKSSGFIEENLEFAKRSIEEQTGQPEKWDLVFSNAAIQWVPDHRELFPSIIAMLKKGGQLVIQMPSQRTNLTNILLDQLADQDPFRSELESWKREVHVLDTGEYAKIFFDNGGRNIQVFEKIYPVVVPDVNSLLDWVSGTALIPYRERLTENMRETFIDEYRALLGRHFKESPVFYPFKRMILSAEF